MYGQSVRKCIDLTVPYCLNTSQTSSAPALQCKFAIHKTEQFSVLVDSDVSCVCLDEVSLTPPEGSGLSATGSCSSWRLARDKKSAR